MSRKRRLLKTLGIKDCVVFRYFECAPAFVQSVLNSNPQLVNTICDGLRHNKALCGNGHVGMETPQVGLYFVAMDRETVKEKDFQNLLEGADIPADIADLWNILIIATSNTSDLANMWKNLPGTKRQGTPI